MPITLSADSFHSLKKKIEKASIHSKMVSRTMQELRSISGTNKRVSKGSTLNRERVKDLSPHRQYMRKRARNDIFKDLFKNDPDFKIFFEWIRSIQKKLNLSTDEFARKLGLKDGRMLRFYYRMERFPSDQTYLRLLRLDRRSKIKIIEKKNLITVKNKGITKSIKLPKMKNKPRIKKNV